MKTYKPNATITFFHFLTNLYIAFIPGLTFTMACFLPNDLLSIIFGVPGIFIIVIALFTILLNIINLICCVFFKPNIIFNDGSFECKDKVIEYTKVTKIEYDRGEVSRSGSTPCSLKFYNGEKLMATVKRPSFRATIQAQKKCKNAKFVLLKWYNTLLYMLGIFIICAILVFIKSLELI